MKNYIALFFLAAFIFACGGEDKKSTSEKKSSAPAKVVDGKKVWKTYCIACHGLYGDMQVNGAKNLNLSILSKSERIEIITNGKNVMTPFKDVLSPEEIKAVAEYTISEFKE